MRQGHQLLLVYYLSTTFLIYSAKAQTPGVLVKRTPESAEQMRQSERRVTLDVQVTDDSGKPVSGLRQQDFTLLDNGQPTTLTSFQERDGGSSTTAPAEVILLLDTMNATFQDVVIERQGIESLSSPKWWPSCATGFDCLFGRHRCEAR